MVGGTRRVSITIESCSQASCQCLQIRLSLIFAVVVECGRRIRDAFPSSSDGTSVVRLFDFHCCLFVYKSNPLIHVTRFFSFVAISHSVAVFGGVFVCCAVGCPGITWAWTTMGDVSKFDLNADELRSLAKQLTSTVSGRKYLAFEVPRWPMTAAGDRIATVVVLFDQNQIDAASRRASLLPLMTGLSTVILMAVISVIVSRGLVRRMIRLKIRIQRVAEGDFESKVADASTDE